MTDIVERLRALLAEKRDAVTHWKTQLNEALAEIEQLRAEKAELLTLRNTEEMQRKIDYWAQRAEKAERHLEIWRRNGGNILLQAEIDELREKLGDH